MAKSLGIRMAGFTLVLAVMAGGWTECPAQGDPSAARPAAAEFDRVYSQWKTLLTELRQLKDEHRSAKGSRRTEIELKYDKLVGQGEALLPKLIEAAKNAYREAPGENKEVVGFFVGLVPTEIQRDNYEEALSLAEMMLEGHPDQPVMAAFAGMASLATMQLDKAEKYLSQADEKNALDVLNTFGEDNDIARQAISYKGSLPYYKPLWDREQKLREAETKADDLPRVLLKTNKGDIVVELFENEAPNTVANIVSLVEKGFYNGTPFHRVLPGFMAQGGDPTGTGTGGPGYNIADECHQPNHRLHFRGSLSMAHSAVPDSNGSQFFLTFRPTPHLDGVHTVFGRVIEGIGVLAKLQRRDPEVDPSVKPDKIVEAKVLRKRDHPYVPKKAGE